MGAMSPAHWAIVAVVLLVLFGSKKLPEAARGLGRSLRILKSEVGEMHTDEPAALGSPHQDPAHEPVNSARAAKAESSP
ncbi:Sec-independent protein translocase subunit TatA [Rhodococcus sp. F64268]|uniref:Sec-independent protein translocase subunit TatA n=1 Tax=unclassified Rhodococcus (in: high G+C Gram-positive bacteria) TaxID=192944 RepID=UPI001F0E9CB2|nr:MULTISPECIES: Sec-independent protein translocase subunit TatA [unclassified Rhodococcus (in: high G+C Gram-positive bacteria)]MCK0090355.1 Sec-independent protein translocase subunit TatA [Rhodococcus sp. F64268]